VNGGSVAVVQALLDVITPDGTLIMPAHSGEYSDPSFWQHPPVPEAWWQIIRDTMPAFDPRFTPTRGMGRIAETFRTWPGALRSSNPQDSFAHGATRSSSRPIPLEDSLGGQSPMAHLRSHGCAAGRPYANNTSFHLGESRAPGGKMSVQGAPILEDGQRVWKSFTTLDVDSDCFDELGADFEKVRPVKIGLVGSATTRLFSQRTAVDFAEQWMTEKRSGPRPAARCLADTGARRL
jgi:aminoglycoside 3-N-acetyltransferase